MSCTTITYDIRAAGTPSRPSLIYDIWIEEIKIANDVTLSFLETEEIKDIQGQYQALFEGRRGKSTSWEFMQVLGDGLSRIWIRPWWEKLAPALKGEVVLVIRSSRPEILAIPWEIMTVNKEHIAVIGWSIRRQVTPVTSTKQTVKIDERLKAGERLLALERLEATPSKVVFAACSPNDLPRLDFEAEEEAFLKAIAAIPMRFHVLEMGTFEELRVSSPATVVHLTGHATLAGFSFENRNGRSDLVSSELVSEAIKGSRIAVVQGQNIADTAGFCANLVKFGVPAAVSIGPLNDSKRVTAIWASFYKSLFDGADVEQALETARKEMYSNGDPCWAQLTLYRAGSHTGSHTGSDAHDTHTSKISKSPLKEDLRDRDSKDGQETTKADETMVQYPIPGLCDGYANPFLGRRKVLQRLQEPLITGSKRILIINGLNGAGKSATATYLARNLKSEGFFPITIASSKNVPLLPSRILDACSRAFESRAKSSDEPLASKFKMAADIIKGPGPVQDRLRVVINSLDEGKYLLLIDGLEAVGEDVDEDMAWFFDHLFKDAKNARTIITSTNLPIDVPRTAREVKTEWLGDLSDAAILRYLLLEPKLKERCVLGDIDPENLLSLIEKLGRSPRYQEQLRRFLELVDKTVLSELLESKIKNVEMPADTAQRRGVHEELTKEVVLDHLFGRLSKTDSEALCRLSVVDVSLYIKELESLGKLGDSKDFVDIASDLTLIRSAGIRTTGHDRWFVPETLRPWLMDKISKEEKDDSAIAAADIFVLKDADISKLEFMLKARELYMEANEMDRAADVTNQLCNYLENHGLYNDLIRLTRRFERDWPNLTTKRGLALFHLGEVEPAKRTLQEAYAGYQDENNVGYMVNTLHNMAAIDLFSGDIDSAKGNYEKALGLLNDRTEDFQMASTLYNLGLIHLRRKDTVKASEALDAALKIQIRTENRSGEAETLQSLAKIAILEKRHIDAKETLSKALEIFREIGDGLGEATTLNSMAKLDIATDDLKSALSDLKLVQQILSKTTRREEEAATWHNIGTIESQMGDREKALESFQKALSIQQGIGDKEGEASSFFQLGVLAIWRGSNDSALRLMATSAMILRSIKSSDLPTVETAVERLASQMKVSPESFVSMISEVMADYRRDHGRKLINDAFSNE